MLSHFHLIPERHGQTDRWTDGQTADRQICYINIVRHCADVRQKRNEKSMLITAVKGKVRWIYIAP